MRNLMAIVFAGMLATAAGIATADEKTMKEHEELGKKGVYPEGKPETTK